MTLNITNEVVYRNAKRLAELTGVSMVEAVGEAVAHRLAEIEPQPIAKEMDIEERRAALNRIAQEMAAELRASGASSDHSFLYDENGLPK